MSMLRLWRTPLMVATACALVRMLTKFARTIAAAVVATRTLVAALALRLLIPVVETPASTSRGLESSALLTVGVV